MFLLLSLKFNTADELQKWLHEIMTPGGHGQVSTSSSTERDPNGAILSHSLEVSAHALVYCMLMLTMTPCQRGLLRVYSQLAYSLE